MQGCKTIAQNDAKPLQIKLKQASTRVEQIKVSFQIFPFSRAIKIEVYVCCSLQIYTKYMILVRIKIIESRLESRYESTSESRNVRKHIKISDLDIIKIFASDQDQDFECRKS